MALRTVPTGDTHRVGNRARVTAVSSKRAATMRMQRTTLESYLTPLLLRNVVVRARGRVKWNLHHDIQLPCNG